MAPTTTPPAPIDRKPAPPTDPDAVVPQLEEHHVTYWELQIAVRVLNAVGSLHKHPKKKRSTHKNNDHASTTAHPNDDTVNDDDGLERYKHINLRPFRKALAACLELHKRTMFQGRDEEAHYEQRIQQRSLKRQKTAETEQQKNYLAKTALRRGRVEKLKALQDNAKDEEQAKLMARMMIPDGHVDSTTRLLQNETSTNDAAAATTTTTSADATSTTAVSSTTTHLPKLRSCYVCKTRYRELHHFYDQLCPSCAALNWHKRHQTANLHHHVAIVTGARVKIGLHTVLKLLRAGCQVIATTRFPNAAAAVYRQQADVVEWQDRLHIYGLDLRDVAGLEAFVRFLKLRHGATGIDIICNNACQTIRRPAGYYTPLVEQEQVLWEQADETHKAILADCVEFERARHEILMHHKVAASRSAIQGHQQPLSILPSSLDDTSRPSNGDSPIQVTTVVESGGGSIAKRGDVKVAAPFETTGLSHSAVMSQMVILPEDSGVSDSILPPGVTDINGQQLDLRTTNSWLLKMEEVSTPEIMECMFVNAIAPFVLNSRLKPLMTIPQDDDKRPDRYIINVSAMEGKFYRYKMPCHPHTNMAKAALNMLTRTSAEDLKKRHRIFMNSVDTGWINDENPLERASKTAEKNSFQTPIDEIDAAARILDPIFVGVNGGRDQPKDYGKFLKDYHESEW